MEKNQLFSSGVESLDESELPAVSSQVPVNEADWN